MEAQFTKTLVNIIFIFYEYSRSYFYTPHKQSFYTPANKVWGVYSDPYVRPFVRPPVPPNL